jgi:hypothetical protein
MVTRGEGGGNAVGQEIGPALGLRRENEDRVAHFRSGTVDIFNIDQVDFFYNTSAPLSEYFWGDETLRRITRIIRTTQTEETARERSRRRRARAAAERLSAAHGPRLIADVENELHHREGDRRPDQSAP